MIRDLWAANTVLERDGVKYQAAANGVCTEIPAENAAEGRQESRARQEQREARTQEARALRHRVLRIPEAARQAGV